MFEVLGIDATMASVYRALLTRGACRIADLAQSLALPEPDVDSAVRRLRELGLLHSAAVNGQVRPTNPALGLGDLLDRGRRELRRRREEMDLCEADLVEMVNIYDRARGEPAYHPPEQLLGTDMARRRIAELARTASSECLTFNPGGAQSAESLDASRPLDRSTIERGVRMRTVYLDSVRNDPGTKRYAKWLTTLGGEVRTVPTLPIRMIIIDRALVITPIDPQDTRAGALQLSDRGVVAGMLDLFTRVWESGTPLGAGPTRDEEGLTRQEKELLRVLGGGATDETAAGRLGLSTRTVRRMVADLMERLAAKSRFEAGVKAGRRNWI